MRAVGADGTGPARASLAGSGPPDPLARYQLVEPATFGQGFHHGLIR
jgi:hypothetical protein